MLTLRQMVNRITKALPEANPAWVKEYLSTNTDCEFENSAENIKKWIEVFRKMLAE